MKKLISFYQNITEYYAKYQKLIIVVLFLVILSNEFLLDFLKTDYFFIWICVYILTLLLALPLANTLKIESKLPLETRNIKSNFLWILLIISIFQSLLYIIFAAIFKTHLSWFYFIPWGASFILLLFFALYYFFKIFKFEKLSKKEIIFIILITAFAFFIRFYDLEYFPHIFHQIDELFMLDVVDTLKAGFNPFAHNGSWPFAGYLSSIFIYFNKGIFAARLMPSILGTLSIPISFLITRSLFNKRVAIAMSVILSVLVFDLHFSRMAIPFIVDQIFVLITCYLLILTLTKKSLVCSLLTGLSISLWYYMYATARIMILVIIGIFIFNLVISFFRKKQAIRNFFLLSIFCIVIFIALTPLIGAYLNNFNLYSGFYTVGGIYWRTYHDYLQIFTVITNSFFNINTLGEFAAENIYGKVNSLLPSLVSAFLFFGLIFSLFKIKRLDFLLIILLAFVPFFLQAILFREFIFYRLVGSVTLFVLIGSLGLAILSSSFDFKYKKTKIITIVLPLILTALITVNFYEYFISDNSPAKTSGQHPLDDIQTSIVRFLANYNGSFETIYYVKRPNMVFQHHRYLLKEGQKYQDVVGTVEQELLHKPLGNSLIIVELSRFYESPLIEKNIVSQNIFTDDFIKVYKVDN